MVLINIYVYHLLIIHSCLGFKICPHTAISTKISINAKNITLFCMRHSSPRLFKDPIFVHFRCYFDMGITFFGGRGVLTGIEPLFQNSGGGGLRLPQPPPPVWRPDYMFVYSPTCIPPFSP